MRDISTLLQMAEQGVRSAGFPETPAGLYDPARYILASEGKRFRPLLTLLAAQVFTDDPEKVMPIAVAMEVFHNFTLVHDDIMDDAPLRRGRETVHVRWNRDTAILSGDVMLIQAYRLLSEAPEDKLHGILEMFNRTAMEVCEGQQTDMDFEKHSVVSVEAYLDMIAAKTSVLLGCCMYCGAFAAGASEQASRLLYEAGIKLGISFQIQDDILDVYGDESLFGKQPGGDIIRKKKTILTLYAMEVADASDAEVLRTLINADADDHMEKVQKVVRMYDKYAVRAHAESLMAQYYEEARATVLSLDVPVERVTQLLQCMTQVFERQK